MMALTNSERRRVRAALSASRDASLGSLGRAMFALWVCASFFVANYLAEFFYLAFRYGVVRVCREHIHVVQTHLANKADPWILSNGDQMSYADTCGLFPVFGILLLVFVVVGYLVVKYGSNKKKESELERTLTAP